MTPGLAPFLRRPGAPPLIYGHRGASAHARENTLSAFECALDHGADGVELDVRPTGDGQLVLSHDPEIELLPGSQDGSRPATRASLWKLSLSQIRALPRSEGEQVLTLREALVFQARTGIRMNVELKGDVPAVDWFAREVAEQIRKHGGDGLLISSFSPLLLRKIGGLLPHVPRAFLIEGESPALLKRLPLSSLKAVGLHPEHVLVDAHFIARARSSAEVINVWTVNDPERARALADLGVDGLVTDDPGGLRASAFGA